METKSPSEELSHLKVFPANAEKQRNHFRSCKDILKDQCIYLIHQH